MRLFVGLMLPAALAGELHASALSALGEALHGAGAPLRVTPASSLHLTLAFLGEVEGERLAPLWAELELAWRGCAAPELDLTHTGAFPRRGSERVLWVGVEEKCAGVLGVLRERTLAACERVGLEPRWGDHDFHPHLTLARMRTRGERLSAGALDAFYAWRPGRLWRPEAVQLVQSEAGAAYRSRGSFGLAGRA